MLLLLESKEVGEYVSDLAPLLVGGESWCAEMPSKANLDWRGLK